MTNLEIDNAYIGGMQVDRMYLGSELVWGGGTPPGPVYSAMPITMNVLSAGTISFKPYNSTQYTADAAAFIPMLNGVNIGEYSPAVGYTCWMFQPSQSTTAKVVNVQPGDVFEIYRIPGVTGFVPLGKGNKQTGANTAYYTFSGSTAGIELYGNILSMCMDPAVMTAYTTWDAASREAGTQIETSYAVCGLFRYMPGLVSAENLWLPNDAPGGCYLNLFNTCQALVYPPKYFPAETATNWCYGSTFMKCTALTESPIIAATAYTNPWNVRTASTSVSSFYTMFSGCTNLNKVTCFMDQTNMTSQERSGIFTNWVNGVAPYGNFYKRNGAGWISGPNGYPQNWTMNIYQE